jgi:hypothetical protein
MTAKGRTTKTVADREELFRLLKGVPCADCGGTFPDYVMEFDHVRGEKQSHVADLRFYAAEKILAEARKCDVVCSNCHAIRTHARKQYVNHRYGIAGPVESEPDQRAFGFKRPARICADVRTPRSDR